MNAEEVKAFLVQYIFYVVGVIGGLFLLALKAYFSEKGKITALKSENARLVDETENIKLKYNKELENVRKDHQLDITKRKYKYESKQTEYLKYFRLIDEFSRQNLTCAVKTVANTGRI